MADGDDDARQDGGQIAPDVHEAGHIGLHLRLGAGSIGVHVAPHGETYTSKRIG